MFTGGITRETPRLSRAKSAVSRTIADQRLHGNRFGHVGSNAQARPGKDLPICIPFAIKMRRHLQRLPLIKAAGVLLHLYKGEDSSGAFFYELH
jgi:hypothetical protein